MNYNRFLIIISLFVFVLPLRAQDKGNAVLLKTIFENISKKHQVSFNYIEEEIAVFKLVPPSNSLTLQEKLNYITEKTQLKFEFISKKYISVINNQKLDKPLCGFLLDEETKEPIIGAFLQITATNSTTITNDLGYFELNVKSANDIEISHLNYKTKLVQSTFLYVENCPKIYLKSIINDLEPVVTTVYLTKGITKRKDGTFEIKPKKIGQLPGLTEPDVFQTMQQIPGINATDENISNTSVRGGTHDQNLFLWNGIRLYQTGHFFGLISSLNPNLAHKINIAKNGTSAFYGDGVSSSVLISTHTDSIENTRGAIGLNLINADFYTKVKTSKKSNIEISGRRSYTDLVTSPTYTNYFNKIFQNTIVTNYFDNQNIKYNSDEDFYFYDFTAQYHQKIKRKTDLFIDILSISNVLDVLQTKTENSITTSKYSCLEQQTYGANALLKTDWNAKNSSEISIYASYYNINSENESIESNQIFNQENTILDTGIKLQNSHVLSDKFTFLNGYQFNEIGVRNVDIVNTPIFSRKIKEVLKNHALIAELKYRSSNDKFNGRIGFRQNYIQEFSTFIFEPRVQLNYKFTPFFQLEIMGESKHQTTSQIVDLQQDFLGIEKRRWTLSNNKDIPIVKSNQASLGFSFNKNNWLLTLENFYKKVDGITSMSQGFQNQYEFVKTNGNYTVYGTEFLIQKQFRPITAWISYTFQENNYDFKTLNTTAFPNNFEIKHTIKSAIISDFKNIKLAIGAQWFTGKPTTLPISTTPIYTDPETPTVGYQSPNSSNLEDYFQVNFSGAYAFNIGKKSTLNLGFSIQNVLNNKTSINQHYRINNNTNVVEQINTFSLERTPNAFLRFTF
ncbi:TonB-dependent receptor [Flavobacterium celericrescens]|uniref:TonB-dependent receptor n=1 Tax=Flavobacterium celericrescens TaxID=2709780 RepID=A0ABX0ID67_9FLAO|nr:TonB-dependent receptor plug domain-containing protein [Flavobacterium celericrescens]NHM05133.1 TonB-dependent receptor [Flavobacterium celericrescens]